MHQHDLREHLDAALERLPAAEREALRLHHLAGCTLQEVADHQRVPLSTAATRVQRGLERLRALLTRRGFALGSLALATLLAQQAHAAVAPDLLTRLTTTASGGADVPAHVVRWSQTRNPWMTRLALATAAGLFVAGGAYALHSADAAPTTTTPGTTTPVPTVMQAAWTTPAEIPLPAPLPDDLDINGLQLVYLLRVNDGARLAQRIRTLPEAALVGPMLDQVLEPLAKTRGAWMALDIGSMLPESQRQHFFATIINRGPNAARMRAAQAAGDTATIRRLLRRSEAEMLGVSPNADDTQVEAVLAIYEHYSAQMAALPDHASDAWKQLRDAQRAELAQLGIAPSTFFDTDTMRIASRAAADTTLDSAWINEHLTGKDAGKGNWQPLPAPDTGWQLTEDPFRAVLRARDGGWSLDAKSTTGDLDWITGPLAAPALPAEDVELHGWVRTPTSLHALMRAWLGIRANGVSFDLRTPHQEDARAAEIAAQWQPLTADALNSIPADALAAGALRLTPGMWRSMRLTLAGTDPHGDVSLSLDAPFGAPSLGVNPGRWHQQFAAALMLLHEMDGTAQCWLQPTPGMPSLTISVPMAQDAVPPFAAAIGARADEEGWSLPMPMGQLQFAWSAGRLIATTHPGGVAAAQGDGFAAHADVRTAVAAQPKDGSALAVLRPVELVRYATPYVGMFAPDQMPQLGAYQQALTTQGAWAAARLRIDTSGMHLHADGLAACAAAIAAAAAIATPKGVN